MEFTSIGSLVDETAPAIFAWGVGSTRNVCRPRRLASGLSAVRTLIPPAHAPSATSAVVVSHFVFRTVFSCGVVKSWSLRDVCTHRAKHGAWVGRAPKSLWDRGFGLAAASGSAATVESRVDERRAEVRGSRQAGRMPRDGRRFLSGSSGWGRQRYGQAWASLAPQQSGDSRLHRGGPVTRRRPRPCALAGSPPGKRSRVPVPLRRHAQRMARRRGAGLARHGSLSATQRSSMQSLRKAEEALRETQAALAHVTRVMMLGELAASIAHEVNQPLAGVVINGNACLRWLAGESPNLAEAREAAQRIIRDGTRASEIIAR